MGQDCGQALRGLINELLGLASSWEHLDRYFPSGPQYAVDLRATVGKYITEEGGAGD